MPNPVFIEYPKYLLVGKEPSLSWLPENQRNNSITDNYKKEDKFKRMNFLFSEEDFIVHYCAYYFLCKNHEKGNFNYFITDISKGAMTVKNASIKPFERYLTWLPLLEKEIQIFQPKVIISIGNDPYNLINRNLNFKCSYKLMHYSKRNSAAFQKVFPPKSAEIDLSLIHFKLKKHAENLLRKLEFPSDLICNKLHDIFNKELTEWKKSLLLYYRHHMNTISIEIN